MLFIFSNSLKPADLSTEQSDVFVNIAKKIIDKAIPDNDIPRRSISVFVRKAAHFTEFCILSAFVTLVCTSFGFKRSAAAVMILTLCAFPCILDELFQLISSGRSCCIYDMLLDYLGVLMGFIAVFPLSSRRHIKKRTKL